MALMRPGSFCGCPAQMLAVLTPDTILLQPARKAPGFADALQLRIGSGEHPVCRRKVLVDRERTHCPVEGFGIVAEHHLGMRDPGQHKVRRRVAGTESIGPAEPAKSVVDTPAMEMCNPRPGSHPDAVGIRFLRQPDDRHPAIIVFHRMNQRHGALRHHHCIARSMIERTT